MGYLSPKQCKRTFEVHTTPTSLSIGQALIGHVTLESTGGTQGNPMALWAYLLALVTNQLGRLLHIGVCFLPVVA